MGEDYDKDLGPEYYQKIIQAIEGVKEEINKIREKLNEYQGRLKRIEKSINKGEYDPSKEIRDILQHHGSWLDYSGGSVILEEIKEEIKKDKERTYSEGFGV